MPSRRKRRIYAAETLDDADELEATDRAFFDHLLQTRYLLAPLGSKFAPRRKRWMLFLLLLATFEAIYAPYMAAFKLPRDSDGEFSLPAAIAVIQWLTDLLFWLDIGLMFRTTIQGESIDTQDVVSEPAQIARHYRRTTFALDVRAMRAAAATAPLIPLTHPVRAADRPAASARVTHSCLATCRSSCSRSARHLQRSARAAALQPSARTPRSASASTACCTCGASPCTTARTSCG